MTIKSKLSNFVTLRADTYKTVHFQKNCSKPVSIISVLNQVLINIDLVYHFPQIWLEKQPPGFTKISLS